jgi:hypothetical protein
MSIFGKKKEEVKLPTIETIIRKESAEEFRSEQQLFKPEAAPLFIKIEKYNQILSSIGELKNRVASMKNVFVVLDRLDDLKKECLSALQEAIENSEKKMTFLNSELLKPSGYKEEVRREVYRAEDLEGILGELKDQVNRLKTELKQVS